MGDLIFHPGGQCLGSGLHDVVTKFHDDQNAEVAPLHTVDTAAKLRNE